MRRSKIVDIEKEIRLLMTKRGIKSDAELARLTSQTPQMLSQRFKVGAWPIKEIERVAAAAGCDVEIRFLDKETGEPV